MSPPGKSRLGQPFPTRQSSAISHRNITPLPPLGPPGPAPPKLSGQSTSWITDRLDRLSACPTSMSGYVDKPRPSPTRAFTFPVSPFPSLSESIPWHSPTVSRSPLPLQPAALAPQPMPTSSLAGPSRAHPSLAPPLVPRLSPTRSPAPTPLSRRATTRPTPSGSTTSATARPRRSTPTTGRRVTGTRPHSPPPATATSRSTSTSPAARAAPPASPCASAPTAAPTSPTFWPACRSS